MALQFLSYELASAYPFTGEPVRSRVGPIVLYSLVFTPINSIILIVSCSQGYSATARLDIVDPRAHPSVANAEVWKGERKSRGVCCKLTPAGLAVKCIGVH